MIINKKQDWYKSLFDVFSDHGITLTQTEVSDIIHEVHEVSEPELSDKKSEIIKEILEERKFQDKKWGVQNHSPMEWCPILVEEVGEVNKAALQSHFKEKIPNVFGERPTGGSPKERREYHEKRYREELIQVAAVALSMIECFDRNKNQ